MSALKQELKVSLPGNVAGLLLNQEEKELAMRPVLPWLIPLLGCCAQTHTVHRIQVGPNALPDRLFPQTLEEANASHCKTLAPQSTRAQTSFLEFSTHLRTLSSATIGSLRGSSQSANLVLFLPMMLSRVESWYSSPASLAAFILQRAFPFWASCGFLPWR